MVHGFFIFKMLNKVIKLLVKMVKRDLLKLNKGKIIYWIFTVILVLIYIFFKPSLNKILTDLIRPGLTIIPFYCMSLSSEEINKNKKLFHYKLLEIVYYIVWLSTVLITYTLLL